MPRSRRICPPGLPVHVVQRGNNRQPCFGSNADLRAYANWLYEATQTCGVAVHAWVFMTNHVHLLVTPASETGLSECMQRLGRQYVRYFNRRYDRTGTLFEGRFRSSLIQTRRYLLACQRYIELNPVRAGMVPEPASYSWSSYRAHALGRPARLWTPHPEYLALGSDPTARMIAYRRFFEVQRDDDLIDDIRDALQRGRPLGSNRHRDGLKRRTRNGTSPDI